MAAVRASNLFAVASGALILLGLMLSEFFPKVSSMGFRWPGARLGHVVGCQVPCYGLAGVFAIFACFYALSSTRLSEATVEWHLWLSLSGVVMFGFGYALLARIGAVGTAPQAGQGSLFTIAAGMLVGPVVFVVGQFIFVISLVQRFALLRH